MSPKRVTVVEVRERNPWGESIDENVVQDPSRTNLYIEGYSDVKTARELAESRGEDVKPLRHRLHWARAQSPSGNPDGKKVAEWRAKGYSVLQWDDAIKHGYKVDLSAAIKGADGSVRLGDLVLMVAPAPVAAAHHQRVRKATRELSETYQKTVETAVDNANVQMGYKKGSKGASGQVFELEGENFKDSPKT